MDTPPSPSFPFCRSCGDDIDPRRYALGYSTCPVCGDMEARKVVRCVAPMAKSNYVLVSNYTELKQLNPKFTPQT